GVIGPIIGGNLAMFSWQYPFLFYGVSILLALAVYFWLPSTGGNSDVSLLAFAANYKAIIKKGSFLVVAGYNFIMAFLMISLVTYVPLYFSAAMGITEGMAGNVLALQGLTGIVVAAKIKDIALRFNTTRLVAGGLLLTVLALLSFPLHTTLIGVAFSVLVFGFGLGIVLSLINTMITDAVRPEFLGAAVSLFNMMNFAGQAASPVVLGAITARLGLSTAFIAAAAVALVAVTATFIWGKLLPVTFK
ncbi:MAG TPA: MFS transporter, partial [Firmicutes bacterium]|nr:MFS transporter [Bacillota bacterium]